MDKKPDIERQKRKYTRKIAPQQKQTKESMNIKLAQIMAKLSDIMQRTGEPMRARAYNKAEEAILTMDTEIKTADDVKGKPGIGETILQKIKEYIETGKVELIEREENNPEMILTNVYGIGPQKAKELIKSNITNIDPSSNIDEPTDVCGNPIYYAMDYGKMTPFLWQGMRELIQRIENVESENRELKSRIEVLESK